MEPRVGLCSGTLLSLDLDICLLPEDRCASPVVKRVPPSVQTHRKMKGPGRVLCPVAKCDTRLLVASSSTNDLEMAAVCPAPYLVPPGESSVLPSVLATPTVREPTYREETLGKLWVPGP